jgi:recombination protein RecR
MIDNLPTLARFLRQLQQVPYLASKNVYRVMHHFLEMNAEQRKQFCNALQDAHENVIKCQRCWTWQERTYGCPFCDDPKRDHTLVCVVEAWQDVYAVERSGAFKGEYHVLGGALNPLEGIGVEHLKIKELNVRVTDQYREIILALNQTPEGEATAAFIARTLKTKGIPITSLARGVPVGASLEFTDRLTLHKALSDRRIF